MLGRWTDAFATAASCGTRENGLENHLIIVKRYLKEYPTLKHQEKKKKRSFKESKRSRNKIKIKNMYLQEKY
jgi:hypothetical protein